MAENGKKTPRPTTTFYVYETDDGGETLTRVGAEIARAASEALAMFFARPENEAAPGVYTAISENARKLKVRNVQQTIAATLADFDPAAGTEPEPEAEDVS